jgi:ubiquinone/menaquinone biosynthesis C-methylase UbiE
MKGIPIMIDKEIEQEMLAYYNERAEEHDIVYMGKGPAVQEHSGEYTRDVARISEMVSGFGRGNAIDIACGTAFWAPYYAPNCTHVTFMDQSANMLAECRKRVDTLRLPATPRFVRGNFFDIELTPSAFDCALTGFLLSHFEAKREEAFFSKLGTILKRSARIMIIDSAWSEKRKKYREKSAIEQRVLEDGRIFRVYKKYFEQSEIRETLAKHGYAISSLHFGDMLFAVIAERTA